MEVGLPICLYGTVPVKYPNRTYVLIVLYSYTVFDEMCVLIVYEYSMFALFVLLIRHNGKSSLAKHVIGKCTF